MMAHELFEKHGCLTVDELKAIYKQAEEPGWIRSEPEKRLETNYEHYKDEIVRFFINDIARVNGRFALCNEARGDPMIYFMVGLFAGGLGAMMLYSVIVSERINSLEYQNEQ